MSRTLRRKDGGLRFNWIEGFYIDEYQRDAGMGNQFHHCPKHSREYRAKAARLHSDGTLKGYRGPRWFRNLYGERVQRRDAKLQLLKFKRHSDYEVCLVTKQHLPYWCYA